MTPSACVVRIRCRTKGHEIRDIVAPIGTSLMRALKEAGMDIEAACDGNLACATCHVVLDEQWYARVPAPKDDEEAMLDSLLAVDRSSRLACQIRLSDGLDGLSLRIVD
jgi:2Fe-2S ferredoxin